MPQSNSETRSVFAAIVGLPNVGKSTLLNALTGEKTAIVTPKPQTTRTRITGILTQGPVQYVFIDTPGFHRSKNKLDERMSRTIRESLSEVDAVLMLFEPGRDLSEAEGALMELIQKENLPALGLVNKIDSLRDDARLEKTETEIREKGVFEEIKRISALNAQGCEEILAWLAHKALPGPHFFPDDAFTDMPEKQLVAELVREKLLLFMREEIPHGAAVEVERFKERPDADIVDIDVVIYCEKKSHKGMIIGKNGQMLKKIATAARQDSEKLLGSKVFLQCWVKIKTDWRDDENKLRQLGFSK